MEVLDYKKSAGGETSRTQNFMDLSNHGMLVGEMLESKRKIKDLIYISVAVLRANM